MSEREVIVSTGSIRELVDYILNKSNTQTLAEHPVAATALEQLGDPVGVAAVEAANYVRTGEPQTAKDVTVTVKQWAIGAALDALHEMIEIEDTGNSSMKDVLEEAYHNITDSLRYNPTQSKKGDKKE